MSRTLHFGTRSKNDPRAQLAGRIEKHVVQRRTPRGYDRIMELTAADYALHVALAVSPTLEGRPRVTFKPRSVIFGRRMAFLNEE